MKITHIIPAFLLLVVCASAQEEKPAPAAEPTTTPATAEAAANQAAAEVKSEVLEREDKFAKVAAQIRKQYEDAVNEHAALVEEIKEKKVELSKEASEKEETLRAVKAKFKERNDVLKQRTVDLENMKGTVERMKKDIEELTGFLNSYVDEFDAGLHVAERPFFAEKISNARNVTTNEKLTKKDIFEVQLGLFSESMDRLEAALGGQRLDGKAILPGTGEVQEGSFVVLGPAGFYVSKDRTVVGTVEERPNKNEPTVIAFKNPEVTKAAKEFMSSSVGLLPFDPTLGTAHKVAATEETFVEHIMKGGKVVYAILVMAGLALLIAVYKFIVFLFVRNPSQGRIDAFLESVSRGKPEEIEDEAGRLTGPVGKMIRSGVEHLGHPKDLIEEVMYEKVLTTKLKLNKMLPFIAICAASAPLLGLLGTVTGIIDTFKAIEVHGTGDVKKLSAGISTALITTELGLIVAIPSLILHAFLSRKARAIIGSMETTAVAFMNQVAKTPVDPKEDTLPAIDNDRVRARVNEILREILGGTPAPNPAAAPRPQSKTQQLPEIGAGEAGA